MRIILTGATGMIGEGVLLACLAHPAVTEILSVSRRPSGKAHPKLREHIVPDFLAIPEDDPILHGFDACFFCAGISSVGVAEADYRKATYDTTLHFARALKPNARMTFIYVSGVGTDSTENGRLMWARVKGKTENDLMKLPFKKAYGYRIGIVKPIRGQEHVLKGYTYLAWLLPAMRLFFPSMYNTMQQVAHSMIAIAQHGFEKSVVSARDIAKLSAGAPTR